MAKTLRTPLHEKALIAEELTVGRKVIWYSIYHGIQGTYEILEVPADSSKQTARFKWRNLGSGREESFFPADLGVIARPGGSWSESNFIIDAGDKNKLPSRTVSKPHHPDYSDPPTI